MGFGSFVDKATGGAVSRNFVNQAAPWALGGVAGGTLSMGLDAMGNPLSSPTAPAAPDFRGAAEATAAGNLAGAEAATAANRVNQANPFGTSQWTQGPDGQWSQNVSFSPGQQQLFDATQQGKAAMLGQGAPEFGANRQRVMDAMTSRVGTDVGRAREQKQSDLVAQGIPVGSEAYQREMEQLDRRETDARQQAEIAATQQAGTEYGAELAGRGQQLGALSAFSPQSPSFNTFYNQQAVPGADYSGATSQQSQFDMNNYNAQVAQKNAMMQGLFSLGGAAIGKSDRRLKRDITRIGVSMLGLPIYLFRYLWNDDWVVGHMSDEVRKVMPGAVLRINGYDAVNYGLLT